MSSRDRHQDLVPDVSYTLDLQRAQPEGGTFLLTIVGAVDDRTVGLFEAGLERFADRAGTLVVDLTSCPSITSAGLEALARRQRDLPAGASLVLVARDPYVLRLLELVGLARKLSVYPSVESALAAAAAGAHASDACRPELALVPSGAAAEAPASGLSLGPGLRIVADQPMYSSAWL